MRLAHGWLAVATTLGMGRAPGMGVLLVKGTPTGKVKLIQVTIGAQAEGDVFCSPRFPPPKPPVDFGAWTAIRS